MEIIAKSTNSKVTVFYNTYSEIFLILVQLGFRDKPVTKRSVTVPCGTGPVPATSGTPEEHDVSRVM